MLTCDTWHIFHFVVCIPFLTYTCLFHVPRQFKRVLGAKVCAWWKGGSVQKDIDADTFAWVVPSMLVQQLVFFIFVRYMVNNGLEFD